MGSHPSNPFTKQCVVKDTPLTFTKEPQCGVTLPFPRDNFFTDGFYLVLSAFAKEITLNNDAGKLLYVSPLIKTPTKITGKMYALALVTKGAVTLPGEDLVVRHIVVGSMFDLTIQNMVLNTGRLNSQYISWSSLDFPNKVTLAGRMVIGNAPSLFGATSFTKGVVNLVIGTNGKEPVLHLPTKQTEKMNLAARKDVFGSRSKYKLKVTVSDQAECKVINLAQVDLGNCVKPVPGASALLAGSQAASSTGLSGASVAGIAIAAVVGVALMVGSIVGVVVFKRNKAKAAAQE